MYTCAAAKLRQADKEEAEEAKKTQAALQKLDARQTGASTSATQATAQGQQTATDMQPVNEDSSRQEKPDQQQPQQQSQTQQPEQQQQEPDQQEQQPAQQLQKPEKQLQQQSSVPGPPDVTTPQAYDQIMQLLAAMTPSKHNQVTQSTHHLEVQVIHDFVTRMHQ